MSVLSGEIYNGMNAGSSIETADAVVIGAGHNGLVAANLLADAGWQVVVLEAADEPGGAVRSTVFDHSDSSVDLFSAFYPLSLASPVFHALDLERYGLRWRHAPAPLAHILPDDRCALISSDVATTARSVDAFAAGDGRAWERLFEQWQHSRTELLDAMFSPFPPVRSGARLVKNLGTAEALRLARRTVMPARRFATETFHGEGAQLLIAGNATHTDVGVDSAGSAIFGWLLAMLAQDGGFPVPVGGSDQITKALVRRLVERGGAISCGRRVRKVLIAKGRAVGVIDAEGELVRARNAVLADVSAPSLYLELLDTQQLPAQLRDDLTRFEWDTSTVKVNWALAGPIPWTARDAAKAGTIHLGADLNGLSRYGTDLVTGKLPSDPFLLLGQMTLADPARSSDGTNSVWAYTHVPRSTCVHPTELAEHVARIEAVVERHAPGFHKLILDRIVQGPADLERENSSLPGGAIGGGTSAVHQQLFFRPTPGLARADTFVDRLYLASASAHPGGGVHGGPGANAARAALARQRVTGGLYRGVINTAHRLVYDF